ncbi:hypothetical protein GCM10027168_06010 [Streptomyces capparidis]
MGTVTFAELRGAFAAVAARGSPWHAWWALAELAAAHAVERGPELGRLARHLDGTAPGEPVPHDERHLDALAGELLHQARARPCLAGALRGWAERHTAGGDRGGQANVIGGAGPFTGPVVQARDVVGGVHVHAPPPDRPPVPRQLPPVTGHFTGREPDLAALDRLRAARPDAAPLVVVLSGTAGVGKTALAARWVHTVADDHPDGVLYADLRGYAPGGPVAPQEALGRFLRALGAAAVPADPAELGALWRSATAGRRVAVVLDNVLSAAQARPLLPGSAGALAVVISRHRLTGLRMDGAVFHRVGPLDGQAGLELLRRGIGPERVEADEEAAREVVALCAGLPLAVCLVAARLASRPRQPVRAMVEALAQDRRRLSVLNVEGEAAVDDVLEESYRVLPDAAARLYRLLGVLPVVFFDAGVAAAAAGVPAERAEPLLDTLVEANLVEETGPDRYRFHDLVRLHAGERGRAEGNAAAGQEALRRVCDWYLCTAVTAQLRLTPAQAAMARDLPRPAVPGPPVAFGSDSAALAWLDAHRENLMAVVRAASGRGWDETAWRLVDAMWPLFLRLRYYEDWIEAHEIGLRAARGAGHRAAERQMLNSGAIGLSAAGRLDEAIDWYGRSRRAAREAGDARDEGQALLGLGDCHREAGRWAEAVPYLERAVALWRECGYPRGAALARVVLGQVALETADPAAAAALFAAAHEELVAVDDPHDAARALAFLGRARASAGAYAAGVADLERALAVFTSSGAVHWQARAADMLGQCAEEHGDAEAARRWYERALAGYATTSPQDARRLGHRLEGRGGPAGA